jgi:mono/diheme cytochrome c family protein
MNTRLMMWAGAIALSAAVGCSEGGDASSEQQASTQANGSAEKDTGEKTAAADKEHPLPGDPKAGADVYQRVCVACHGKNGTGNGGITGGDFVNSDRLAKSNEKLLDSIRNGVDANPPMPAQKGALSEQEMKDALAYIRSEFGTQ